MGLHKQLSRFTFQYQKEKRSEASLTLALKENLILQNEGSRRTLSNINWDRMEPDFQNSSQKALSPLQHLHLCKKTLESLWVYLCYHTILSHQSLKNLVQGGLVVPVHSRTEIRMKCNSWIHRQLHWPVIIPTTGISVPCILNVMYLLLSLYFMLSAQFFVISRGIRWRQHGIWSWKVKVRF